MTKTIESFFKQHKKQLNADYPGITLRRLIHEIGPAKNPEKDLFPKLLQGIPLEYITKKSYFYNFEFDITTQVLIPRFETEMLVDLALKIIGSRINLKIIDVGTGSGAIILSLLYARGEQISKAIGTDICIEALNLAQKNYSKVKSKRDLKTIVSFIQADRLTNIKGEFDLVLSNPPYIAESEKKGVHHQVLKYEPHKALFLNDFMYYRWYEVLLSQVFQVLKKDGVFILEGHINHLENLKKMALKLGFVSANIIKDLTDRDRFLISKK